MYRTHLVNIGIGQGQKESVPFLYSQTEYDEQGHVLMQCSFNAAELVTEKYVFEYDNEGRLVHETYYTDDSDPSEEKTYEYDETGRLVREMKHYLDGSADTTTFHYDSEGMLTEKITADDEGEIESRETFTYQNGKLVLHETTEADNELILKEEFDYDSRGNVISHVRNDDETGEFFRLQLTYSPDGHKEKEEIFNDQDQLVETTYFQMDEQGRVIQTTEDSGRSRRIRNFSFDDRGNNLGYEEVTGTGDKLVVVEHLYDPQNNPQSSLIFMNGAGRSQSQHYELRYEYEYFS